MRPWASWTARTAALTFTAGLAATASGLSGVALAASGTSAGSDQAVAPAGIPGDVCSHAGALLGIAAAAVLGVAAGPGGPSAPGTDGTSENAPATRTGDTNVPAATQLAGLGALPGLVDLPSPAGLAGTPARNGAQGGGIPMPGTALSAANSGMSSDSFVALVVGALLAGASALKIVGRRSRDRKAGLE